MTLDIAGLRALIAAYAPHQTDAAERGWPCCRAHELADALPAALDEIERLQAEVDAHDGEYGDLRAKLSATEAEVDRLRGDVTSLWPAAKIYLDAIDNDPEHEYLTLPEAFLLTKVREAIERHSPDAEGGLDA